MMNSKSSRLCAMALAAACISWSPVGAPAAEPIDFAHDVLPLLKARCGDCHTDGTYEGAVSFDTRESLLESGAATPGDAAHSTLIERVSSDDPDIRMPPEGEPLTAAEVDILRRWIDSGLPWEEGFTFRANHYEAPLRPRRPELPPAEPGADHPIDRIVFAYWREHGIEPPPLVDDAAFYRRASLDLVGLPPTPQAVDDYAAEAGKGKRDELVRRLLDDRVAYADHWLSFWNDLLRNDYAGTGYIDGGREQITGWLYRALLGNKPYDQFVRELISPTPASQGFVKGIVWRGQVNASQRPELQFAQNVGQVFLGANLKCASCHDSFIDSWKLTDAYGLAAIAAETPLELNRCDVPTGQIAVAKFLYPELGNIDPEAPRSARLQQLSVLITHPENGRLTRTIVNRLWGRMMGRGIVHPVDSMGAAPWSEDLLDYLSVHLSDSGYDLKATLAHIATSRVYASQSSPGGEAPAEDYKFAGPIRKRMTAEQFVDALAHITGIAPENTVNDDVFVKRVPKSDDSPPRPFVRSSLVISTPLMRTLGRPGREQVVSTRPAELTTLEALELSNGEPLAELLNAGARQLIAAHPNLTSEALCQLTFNNALTREPTDQELTQLREIAGATVTAEGLADVLWCIVMLPEFQFVN